MMNYSTYLSAFQNAADKLDKTLLKDKKLEVYVGIVLDSVCLKVYKKEWAGGPADPINAASRIFFSAWVNEQTLQQQRVYYNIHAFKIRHLPGYKIKSREFAAHFRALFKPHMHKWEHVSTDHGPLTLMEGWVSVQEENAGSTVLQLADNFLHIDHLIDDTLKAFV